MTFGGSMACTGLGDFILKLEEAGELNRVAVETDPILEIAEITDRVSKTPDGGKALLFEKVRGSGFPVVTNIFGSRRRICTALGIDDLDELTVRMEGLLSSIPGASPADRIEGLCSHPEFARFAPRTVIDGPCQEFVQWEPDLAIYPILKNFQGDGAPDHDGRFLTLPVVMTVDPDSGQINSGIYRVEVIGKDRVSIHWRETSGGACHWLKYRERGERMPVAIALGGDPAEIYAASAPLPEMMEEMQLAGFLKGEPVGLVSCLTNPLRVPADAEMVLEGFIDPGETCGGGAFGNHTGMYDPPREVPVMRLSCITRRERMIYPATIVGRPPMEDCWLAKASERLLLPFLRLELPEVKEMNMPMEGIFHGCAVIAMEKSRPGHPRELMEAIWRGGRLGSARLLITVDAGTDLRDLSLVAWRVLNLVDWRTDLYRDGKERENNSPGRLGVDATSKPKSSDPGGSPPGEIGRGRTLVEMVDGRWREYGI
jgi:4-hydroxy-3-polyprenylbenzoate decarboxylase